MLVKAGATKYASAKLKIPKQWISDVVLGRGLWDNHTVSGSREADTSSTVLEREDF